MSVIKKVQSKVNFLRKSVLTMQLELEKYCFNELNYNFAQQLCQFCIISDVGDVFCKKGIILFGHLLTTYKNYTYHAVKEVLRKRTKGFYKKPLCPTDLQKGQVSCLEYMINKAMDEDHQYYIDEWHFLRDKITVLLQSPVESLAPINVLTSKEMQKIERWSQMLTNYNYAIQYLIETILSYTMHPVDFEQANEICRLCMYSNYHGIKSLAIYAIGYIVRFHLKMPDPDLVAEINNIYYHKNNLLYRNYWADADDVLSAMEITFKLEIRTPQGRKDLVDYYLERLGDKKRILKTAKEDADNDIIWFIINETVDYLQKCHLWDVILSAQLGIMLVNKKEVNVMEKLIAALKKLIANVGEKQGNECYLQAREFAELMQVAGQAHQVLLANDEEFKKIYFK